MDTVAIADTIKMSQTTGETAWRFLKKMARSWSQLFSTAESTTATPMQKKQTIESISCAAGASTCCTGTSGSTRMAQFLQECTCTIKTLIQVTIPWAIWRSSRENSTWPNTWKRPEQEGAPQRIWRNSPVSAPSPKSGTEVRRGSSGTKTSQESSSKKGAPRNSLWKKQGQSVEKTPLKRFAQSAARRFSRWLLGVLYAAKRAPVERIEPGNGRKQVFNLSVEDAHSYYANGILVHNCDCVQMCLARYRSGGFIRLPSDYQDEDADDFKARQRAYYG